MRRDRKKIKVLQAVGMMNRGGAESFLMNVFRHIDREKIELHFLTHSQGIGAYDREIRELGGTLYFLPSLGTLGYARYVMALRRFMLGNGPFDIVHSHLDWQGGAIALAARTAGVKRVIVHSHSSSWQKPDTLVYNLLHRFNRFLVASFAHEGWACSDEAGVFLFSKGFLSSGRYRKIRNAIDLDGYAALTRDGAIAMRHSLDIPDKTLVLGHVGSFSEPKNHTFLVKLAVQLKGMSWDFRLVLVGDGALRNTIHGLVESSGVSAQVIFTGLRDDIPEWMNMFDVFLFPSLFEGLGIVVIEAQAAGIPCIVSEHVPGEVDMGLGLVQRQPLDSIEHWTVASEDSRRRRRLDQSEVLRQIANRGYSIRESIKDIAGLYESISASG
jgi:glycosyltransferase EpsF